MLEVGLLFGGGMELRPEWAVFMADFVVEALGKPYNRLF